MSTVTETPEDLDAFADHGIDGTWSVRQDTGRVRRLRVVVPPMGEWDFDPNATVMVPLHVLQARARLLRLGATR